MTKDEALRLALEALKHGGCPPDCKDGMTDSGGVHPWGEAALIPCPNCKTITAIKQALANDALDKMAENERELGIQMQPEPVIFYRCKGCDTAYEEAHPTSCDCMEDKGFERIEYFTSPPKRKPLTDEEIETIWQNTSPYYDHQDFARDIEAAHGIKEKA